MSDAGLTFSFSTDGLKPAQAFDLYHAVFAAGAEARRESDDFRASLCAREFARMQIHERRLHHVRHERDAAQVRRVGFGHFTMTLCLGGAVTGRSEDTCWTVRPGELLLLDMGRPATLQMIDAHVLTVPVGREVVEAAIGDAHRFHARVFDRAAASPLRCYLLGLLADRAGGPDGPLLPFQRVSGLLGDLLSGETPVAAQRLRGRRLLLAHRAIEAMLDEPAFGVPDIARAVGLSRAGLYRLFAPLGGVDRHLTDRRIARYQRLLAPGGDPAGIGRLSQRAGFDSESHASRVFLSRLGERPGAFRRRFETMTDAQRAGLAMRIWSNDLQ